LHFDLLKVDPSAAQIKQKLLTLVSRVDRQRQRLSTHWKITALLVGAVLPHRDQSIRLFLREIDFRH
jgi:hypothetical protein